jgi:hypothetical protein
MTSWAYHGVRRTAEARRRRQPCQPHSLLIGFPRRGGASAHAVANGTLGRCCQDSPRSAQAIGHCLAEEMGARYPRCGRRAGPWRVTSHPHHEKKSNQDISGGSRRTDGTCGRSRAGAGPVGGSSRREARDGAPGSGGQASHPLGCPGGWRCDRGALGPTRRAPCCAGGDGGGRGEPYPQGAGGCSWG